MSLASLRLELYDDWDLAATKLASAKTAGENLDSFFMSVGGFDVWLNWVIFRGDLCYCADKIISQVAGVENSPLLLWMELAEDELGGGEEFDMDILLSTMITAEYEQFTTFIGIVDGYRSALWDQWYNFEYYAALARGFKEKAP